MEKIGSGPAASTALSIFSFSITRGMILVLTEDGIAEEGTHQELMEKDGVYAKLCKAGL